MTTDAPHRIALGGKSVYGARIGILMLETRFPRIPGDAGHAATWPVPVLYRVVPGATPRIVVHERGQGLGPAFLEAAKSLVRDGVDGITTTGGFLSVFQRELAEHCGVPVASSSLLQIPLEQAQLPPNRRVGVLTVHGRRLGPDHLVAAGAPADTPVMGTENGRELTRVLLGDEPRLDIAQAERDVVEAGRALVERHPEVGAIVLECHNMAPYARAVNAALGLPVHDVASFVRWFHAGLEPHAWPG
jgi:hypothetical protein